MSVKYTTTDYKLILNIIYEEHSKHTGKWLASIDKTHYNLKRTQIRHVCSDDPVNIEGFIDESFLDYLDNYKTSLGSLYIKIMHRLESEAGVILNGRIKNDDSILLKLHRKRFEDDGKFPINKYLNDLLGFRLIDKKFEENVVFLQEHLDQLKNQNKRYVHKFRIIGDLYRGYHVYFMGEGAKYFPIELQIWNKADEINNLESHEDYKKDYTYWPMIYSTSGL